MIITVDCRWIDASGIAVYLRECIPFFFDSTHTFLLLGNAKKLLPLIADKENITVLDCDVKPFSITELIAFPRCILKKINSGDLYYSPYFNIPGFLKIPVFTTIHDIVFPDIPELTSRFGLAARMWFYRRAFRLSKKIFTVSEFSKSRIKYYSKNTVPVIVTHSAIQPHFVRFNKNNVKKTNTIIFIGNIKKHKGIDTLLDAFKIARSEGLPHQLIIVGSMDNFRTMDTSFMQKINMLGPDAVHFTGFISDEKILEYLSSASLLVQPSLYEGFGLPPLEAMILGTKALISDISVFREIYNGYPVSFFRAGDSTDLKEKIMELLYGKTVPCISLPEHLAEKYTFAKTVSTIMLNLV
jgi:glycosyltransferase involved in cell wall biosynthesis